MSEEIIVVDKDDNVIGSKSRDSVGANDIYRASALWLTNPKGEILLAKRSFNKKQHPGKWGPAVAGTLAVGEDYDSNIIKEMGEELGLGGINFTKGPKLFSDSEYPHFTQWYKASVDIKNFNFQKEEVEEVKWFSKKELTEQLENNSEIFLPNMPKYFKLL